MPNQANAASRAVTYAVLAVVGTLIWALTYYIEWYGDALCYRFSFLTGEPITGITDIWPSQYAHYYMMNGRIVAHIFCQGFTALWGKAAFATCNSLVYIIFIILFCRTARASLYDIRSLSTAVITILLLTDTSYVPNCQIGYIWTGALTLGFILLYYKGAGHKHRYLTTAACLIYSVIAGNGNEAIEIGVAAALAVDLIINRGHRDSRQWLMAAGFFIGVAALCLSPGIIRRAGSSHNILFYSVYHLIIYSRILYLLIIIVAVKLARGQISLKRLCSEEYFCLTAIVTLTAFNLTIGINGMRQLFGIELFSAILSLRLLKGGSLPTGAIILLGIVMACMYILKFEYLRDYNRDFRAIKSELTKSAQGPIFYDFSRYSGIVHPSEVYRAQESFHLITSGILDDIIDRGNHYINIYNGDLSHLFKVNVYPTALSRCIANRSEYLIDRCKDGTYIVAKRRDSDIKFGVYYQNIFGKQKNNEPEYIDFGRYDQLNLTEYGGYQILLFNNQYPLSTISHITAIR